MTHCSVLQLNPFHWTVCSFPWPSDIICQHSYVKSSTLLLNLLMAVLNYSSQFKNKYIHVICFQFDFPKLKQISPWLHFPSLPLIKDTAATSCDEVLATHWWLKAAPFNEFQKPVNNRWIADTLYSTLELVLLLETPSFSISLCQSIDISQLGSRSIFYRLLWMGKLFWGTYLLLMSQNSN